MVGGAEEAGGGGGQEAREEEVEAAGPVAVEGETEADGIVFTHSVFGLCCCTMGPKIHTSDTFACSTGHFGREFVFEYVLRNLRWHRSPCSSEWRELTRNPCRYNAVSTYLGRVAMLFCWSRLTAYVCGGVEKDPYGLLKELQEMLWRAHA